MRKTLRYTLFIVLIATVPKVLLAGTIINGAHGQAITVSGTVTDGGDAQSPLPGVNVLVKGTNIGTVTDASGKYTLQVPSGESILVFSFIGYLTEEINVGDRTVIDLSMTPDVQTLSEIVVVGAVMKKTDLTGSVANLEGEKLKEISTASVTQAMTGRMAGVLIQNSPGVSGGASIKVRGNNSLQFGVDPIFVVDGLIMDGGYNLINPNDIESVDVLKDASSTALYGARGANGVVIITTKKGKKGEPRVTYDGWVGFQEFSKTLPRLGAKDIFDLRVDAYANTFMDANPGANRQAYINNSLLDPNNSVAFAPYEFDTYNSGKSYDWLKRVTRSGFQQNHTMSFSRGTDDGSYYMSANYTKNVGLMKNSDYNRFTGKLNMEQNVKKWLKVGTNTTYSRSHESYIEGSVFPTANGANPLLPVTDDDSLIYMWWGPTEQVGTYNPVRSLRIDGESYQSRLMTSNYVSIKPIDKITLRSTISIDLMDQRDFWYTPRDLGQSVQNSTNGTATQRNDHWLNWQWDNTINYEALNTNDHMLAVLGGFSMQKNGWDYNQLNAVGFGTDKFSFKNAGAASDRAKFYLASDFSTHTIMSYLGRVNYSYRDRYFATVTTRIDGSSSFGDGHKWGVFPSVALGWNITQEDFFQNLSLSAVNLVKLRAGYGQVGNQNVPNFAYKTLYNPVYSGGTTTYAPSDRLGNENLEWEKQKQLNLGLDLAFMANKYSVSVDYFTINNENLLLQRSLSTTTGFKNVIANQGELENKGIEITANANLIQKQDLKWSISANISSARNKVKKLYGNVDAIYAKGGYTSVEIQREGNYFVGKSVNSIYVYKFDKIAQEGDMDYVSTLDLGGRIVRPGDILPLDKDNNGIINDDDRYVVGRKDPKFYGGFSTDVSYRNFSLNAVFSFNYGAKRISYLYEAYMNGTGTSAAHKDILKRWTPEHTNTNIPRAYFGGGRFSPGDVDWAVQDASFLRVSAVTLAYTFPQELLSKAKFTGLRVYFSANNAFVVTKYKGYDPEGGESYPMSRTFVTGINLSF